MYFPDIVASSDYGENIKPKTGVFSYWVDKFLKNENENKIDQHLVKPPTRAYLSLSENEVVNKMRRPSDGRKLNL